MSRPVPIEYADASPQVRAVYDDIKRSRNVEDVNNFWRYLVHRAELFLLKARHALGPEVFRHLFSSALRGLGPLVNEIVLLVDFCELRSDQTNCSQLRVIWKHAESVNGNV